jgi:hypothetical protein
MAMKFDIFNLPHLPIHRWGKVGKVGKIQSPTTTPPPLGGGGGWGGSVG